MEIEAVYRHTDELQSLPRCFCAHSNNGGQFDIVNVDTLLEHIMSLEVMLAQRANEACQELESCILELLKEYPNGMRNIEVARCLGLESKPGANHKNWLTWSILKRLESSGRVKKSVKDARLYVRNEGST